MIPFTKEELEIVKKIEKAFGICLDEIKALPHNTFSYKAGNTKENSNFQADTRLTMHMKALENELIHAHKLFQGWIKDPREAGEANG